jgi:hypothetical protein
VLDVLAASAVIALAHADPGPRLAHEPKEWVQVPATPHNRLVSDSGELNVGVGLYTDCTRATDVSHTEAAVDACIHGKTYFIGHNPGPFTATLDLKSGSELTYFDGAGSAHRLRIVSERTWNRFWGAPPLAEPDVAAQFQTCVTLDAVWDRILDAVPE